MDEKHIKQFEKLSPKKTKNGRTRSEIGKASKRKGKTGERYFANKLTEISGISFQRVPNSGAFIGASNRERLKTLSRSISMIQLGDIITPDEIKQDFIFEVKNYAELDFHNFFNPKCSRQVINWLEELIYDIESYMMYINFDIIGFLCIKITRKANLIVGNIGNIKKHNLKLVLPHLIFKYKISDILKHSGWNNKFFLCDFTEFMKYNNNDLFVRK